MSRVNAIHVQFFNHPAFVLFVFFVDGMRSLG
jgi:hypothetical protein